TMQLSCFSVIEVFNSGMIMRSGANHDSTFIDICNSIQYTGDHVLHGYAYLTAGTFLPITLISFNADEEDQNVNITWSTASEKNNEYFTVERSVDGIKFLP